MSHSNLSIKLLHEHGKLEVLPPDIDVKYKFEFGCNKELVRSIDGKLVPENRMAKVIFKIEGKRFITDFLREEYLNSVFEVVSGIRLYSTQGIPQYADMDSILKREGLVSYRIRLNMKMKTFECENNEGDIGGEDASKWTLVLEQV